jgi:hypothetical protein
MPEAKIIGNGPLPENVRPEVQRILDAEARRLLAEQLEQEETDMADIEDEIGPMFERSASETLAQAEKLEAVAEVESDPEAKRILEEAAADAREFARRELERAAVVDDPVALQRWVDGLSPERRDRIARQLERLLAEDDDEPQ